MSDLDTTRLSRAARHKLRAVAAEENGRDRLSLRRLVLIQNSMIHALYRQSSSSPLQYEASSSVSPPPHPQTSLSHTHYHSHSHQQDTISHPDSDFNEPHTPVQSDDFVFPDLDFTDPQTLEAEANWLESVLENLDDSDLDFAPGAGSGGCLEDEGAGDESSSDIDMSETWFPSPACPCSFYPFNNCVCHMTDSYPPLPDYDDVPDLDLDLDDDEDGEEYFGPPTPLSTSGLDDQEDDTEEGGFAAEQDSPTYFSTALRPHSRFIPPVCDFQMIF